MKNLSPFYIILCIVCLNTNINAQQAGLSQSFAKRYLNLSIGRVSSVSQVYFSSNSESDYSKYKEWGPSFTVGFGYNMDRWNKNLYIEYSLSNSSYYNMTPHSRTYSDDVLYPVGRIFNWVNELGLKQYLLIHKKWLYIAPFAGLSLTSSRANKPNSGFIYINHEDYWVRHTSPKYTPGVYIGAALKIKLSKRMMLFGQYKYQRQLSGQSISGEVRYINNYDQITDQYKSRTLPGNSAISFGFSMSLENSAFYKK